MQSFYSNGKLLLTGEYIVLDGAQALALPTKFGQNLSIEKINKSCLIWESYTNLDKLWLQVEFDLPRLRIASATFDSAIDGGNDALAENLQNILIEAKKINKTFLSDRQGYLVKSKLTFPRNWGLGSSSTLINNIAYWAQIDAFKLQFNTFGGSAYDIACAQQNTPILYQLSNQKPIVKSANFNPSFKNQLYFVHLNKKQNSRDGIAKYQQQKGNISTAIDEISKLTQLMLSCTSLKDFEKIMVAHEALISSLINQNSIQKEIFSDYFGQIKSLGAWGGDFILATGNEETPNYFKQKGFETVISYGDIIL